LGGLLQVVNEIATTDRRAEVISSYLVIGFLGNALPVVGVGVLSQVFNPMVADATLAGVVALLAIIALVAAGNSRHRQQRRRSCGYFMKSCQTAPPRPVIRHGYFDDGSPGTVRPTIEPFRL
jgi:hypothetical protein